MTKSKRQWFWWCGLLVSLGMLSCNKGPEPGQVQDEARLAGRSAASVPAAHEDYYFRDMDGGAALSPEEVKGRNMWIVWTGGDDKMWDTLTVNSVGTLDFLKT